MEERDPNKILEMLEFEPHLEEEDLKPIISELRRIIHDDSVNKKGFQGKFARMISELQQKRIKVKKMDKIKQELGKKDQKHFAQWVLDKLQEEIAQSSGKDKFKKLLKIAQVREKLQNSDFILKKLEEEDDSVMEIHKDTSE